MWDQSYSYEWVKKLRIIKEEIIKINENRYSTPAVLLLLKITVTMKVDFVKKHTTQQEGLLKLVM